MELSKTKLKKTQRIFVNRSLNMGNIRALGFDMDHTLVSYNRVTFEELAFAETVKKFIQVGYPEELSQLKFKPNFVIRGLLVDIDRGNLLKVDCHKYVKIAFHGHTMLDKETRHRLYNSGSFRAFEFLTIDSFFALSEVQLFCEIVDYMKHNPGKIQKTFREVYADIRKYIDLSHQDGSIKNKLFENPGKFLVVDKHLPEALVRYLDGNKALFLLTNSTWEYTDRIMSLVFDGSHPDFPRWRDYFKYVIVSSSKPHFFTDPRPFQEVDQITNSLMPFTDNSLQPGKVYHGGNAQLFQQLTGFRGDEILYVGDHLYSDIIRSKDLLNWRTLLVMQELNSELPILEAQKSTLDKIMTKIAEKETKDEELQILRSKISSNARQARLARQRNETKKSFYLEKTNEKLIETATVKEEQLEALNVDIRQMISERESAFHPVWGELMRVSLEPSRFANQISDYACIYTNQVSNLRFYSPMKRFTSIHETLPHEL